MSNAFNMACPKCGRTDQLDVAATVWVRVVRDYTDADAAHDHSHEWNDDSACHCDACGWTGIVLNASYDEDDNPVLAVKLVDDPDQTVWYFRGKEKQAEAGYHVGFNSLLMQTEVLDQLPAGAALADMAEFKAWVVTFAHLKRDRSRAH